MSDQRLYMPIEFEKAIGKRLLEPRIYDLEYQRIV
jgi:hypothetical protein